MTMSVDAGGGDRLALAVLVQYRMAITEQIHLLPAPWGADRADPTVTGKAPRRRAGRPRRAGAGRPDADVVSHRLRCASRVRVAGVARSAALEDRIRPHRGAAAGRALHRPRPRPRPRPEQINTLNSRTRSTCTRAGSLVQGAGSAADQRRRRRARVNVTPAAGRTPAAAQAAAPLRIGVWGSPAPASHPRFPLPPALTNDTRSRRPAPRTHRCVCARVRPASDASDTPSRTRRCHRPCNRRPRPRHSCQPPRCSTSR
jgi:hypothetical protein